MLTFSYTINSELPFLPAAGSFTIYTLINQLCTNDWLVLYPRGLWGKYGEIFSSYISVFTHAQF
jgi:hypothetical protein